MQDIAQWTRQGGRSVEIGYSLLGRPILALHSGDIQGPQVLVQAGMHAREWVTTPLVIRMMQDYRGSGGVWCVPMTNPDGALLCQQGLESVAEQSLKDFLLQVNDGNPDFRAWKANGRAVDLNVNWNADWGTGEQNVFAPAPSDYVGMYPLSEIENVALRDLTNRVQPRVTLSYHARGEVIYRGFGCRNPYPACARKIADATGFPLLDSTGSAGGYKDWFVATTNRLGLTIEVGSSDFPYEELYLQLDAIVQSQAGVLDIATACAAEIAQTEQT